MNVKTGLDLVSTCGIEKVSGCNAGLLAHPASVTCDLVHSFEILTKTSGITVVSLFGPQHGWHGNTQDNMIEWEGADIVNTSIPVHSLYGKFRKPSECMLQNIDIMIVDLQDIGTRVYTFIQTVYLVIEACKERGIPVYVLDRPNPIGSTTAGAILDPDYFSFVGLTSLPMQHGMTIGELSHRYGRQLNADVHVIKMSGWNRTGFFDETGLPWVMPSPNMPSLDTAIVYPGTVLIEGTNLSEGRGTTRPFEIIGAPDIDPNSIADELNSLKLPGTHFRPVQFEPVHQKYVEQLCGGVHIHVTDRSKFEAVRTGIAVLLTMKRHDRKFKWLEPPYEYEKEKMPIDILSGSAQLREMVNDNSELHEFDTWLNCGITGFLEDRKQDLLY